VALERLLAAVKTLAADGVVNRFGERPLAYRGSMGSA
jgi:hypothetical protein